MLRMALQSPHYTPEEDALIWDTIENRPPGRAMRKAMSAKLHLLPGRTIEGVLTRYRQVLTKRQLGDLRQQASDRAAKRKELKTRTHPRKGGTIENWTPEEDAIMWNFVQTRKPDVLLSTALEDVFTSDLLPGRTHSSIKNRYYVLTKRMGETETVYMPKAPEVVKLPDPKQQFNITYTPSPSVITVAPTVVTWSNVVTQSDPEPEPIPAQRTLEVPTPRLAEKAEEFIKSLYGVVQENESLRSQVSHLNKENVGAVEQLRKELDCERDKTNRLLLKISEMEEDRDAFLRLMDKARVIGREEIGVK